MARIEDYGFGRIVVDGRTHTRDVIVLPRRTVGNWWRKDGHGLVLEDLQEVLDELPGRLIVGTGAYGRLSPDPRAIRALEEQGTGVTLARTGEAVHLYRQSDPEQTAAALHLTC